MLSAARIGVGALVSALMCAAAEVALRALERRPEFRVFENASTGPCNVKPNLSFVTYAGGERIEVSTNSAGMRWREVPVEKPAGKKRIAFVGDSFTFGEWADRTENTFVGVVERQLSGSAWEALNFGVPGDGLREHLMRLKERFLAYDPDVVVLMFYAGNDLTDEYLGPNRTDCATGLLRRDLVERHLSTRERFVRNWERRSALFRALRAAEAVVFDFDASEFVVSDNPLDPSYWSQLEYSGAAADTMDRLLEHLRQIRDLVGSHGAQLVVISLPFRQQVYAADEAGDRYDITLPQRRFEGENVTLHDLLGSLRRHAQSCQQGLYVPHDPHFTTHGHEVAGALISRALAPITRAAEVD